MNFASFDLNLLRVLDALLREQSTTRAGARIGLSQPAVSAALGRLRHALGDPLFVRQGHGLAPTDFARALEAPLRAEMDRLEALLSPAGFDPGRARQVFRLSGSDFFAELLMPPLARRLANEAPGVRAQLVDLIPDYAITPLDEGKMDIALMPVGRFPDWIDTLGIFRASFVMIARAGHPRLARAGVAPGAEVPLDLFCDLGHVLMSIDGKLRAMADEALARIGRERRVMMTMPFFSGVARVVAESDLVALMPRQHAHAFGRELNLELYAPPVAVPAPVIGMVWHRRSSDNPAHRWMRGLIGDILSPLNKGEAPLA